MNGYFKSNLILFHLMVAAFMAACLPMRAAVTIKDDIKLTVSSSKDENGETKIDCVLTNESSSVLGYNIWANMLERFQISLSDENGLAISQESDWAERYGQIGSIAHDRYPRGAVITLYKKPGEKIECSFLLREAYGERASKGRKLTVSWENNWGGDTADIPTTVDPVTGRMNQETVPIRYQGKWDISVPMALNSSGEEINSPPEKETPQKQQDKPKEAVGIEPPQNTAGKSSGNSATPPSQNRNPLWWLLGFIPLSLLVWFVIRQSKTT